MSKRDHSRKLGKRHFLLEDLWIRLLIMNRHTKHFRAEGRERKPHNKHAWKVVTPPLHKSEQHIQPSHIRALHQSVHHYNGLRALPSNCLHSSLKSHLQLSTNHRCPRRKEKKKDTNHTYYTGRAKNFVANPNTHFYKYSTQMDKHSKKRTLY